jgi:hypothetical protein
VLPEPVALDDYAGGKTGEVVVVAVLDNDTAPDSALVPASVTVVTPMAHGTVLAVSAVTGEVTYQPDVAYEGVDEFAYRVCNTHGLCDTATVFTATPPVDLEVTITRDGPELVKGDRAEYLVTVTNLGPRFAEGPLTLALTTTGGLDDLNASGVSWDPAAATDVAGPHLVVSRSGPVVRRVPATVSVQLPGGLPVETPSYVTLTGTVTGGGGSQIRVDAEVAGPSIELVYANNEASTLDTVRTDRGDVDDQNDTDDRDPDRPDRRDDDSNPRGDRNPRAPGQDIDGRQQVTPVTQASRTLPATGADTPGLVRMMLLALVLGAVLLRTAQRQEAIRKSRMLRDVRGWRSPL